METVDTPVEPEAQPEAEPAPEAPAQRAPEDYEAEIARLRKEAAGWRTKLREVEPKAKAYDEVEEAKKSEVQRATERATAAEQALADRETELNRLLAATMHGLTDETDISLIGSGTREEMDARAAHIAQLRKSVASTPPPSDRPVESLRPGASPAPPSPVDHSYPAAWNPRNTERS